MMVGENLDKIHLVFSHLDINQLSLKCLAELSLNNNLLEWGEWVFNRLDSNRHQISINLDSVHKEVGSPLLLHSQYSKLLCKDSDSLEFKPLWVNNKWDSLE